MIIWIEVALVMLGFGQPVKVREIKPCKSEIAECRVIVAQSTVTPAK